jgi:uncharacterized membrane protein
MSTYNRFLGTSVQRLEALSDALFAIALTVTVLEVRLPERRAIMNSGVATFSFTFG